MTRSFSEKVFSENYFSYIFEAILRPPDLRTRTHFQGILREFVILHKGILGSFFSYVIFLCKGSHVFYGLLPSLFL